jgi:hypothetical protein
MSNTRPLSIEQSKKKYEGILHYNFRRIGRTPTRWWKKSFLSLLKDSTINNHYGVVARGVPEVVNLTNKIAEQSTAKQKAWSRVEAEDEAKKLRHGPASAKIVVKAYWDCPEAKKLFKGHSSDARNIVEVLEEWIEQLQHVNQTMGGWRDLVDKHDEDNLCSPYDIFYVDRDDLFFA